jgi:hypothetical protein
MADFRDSNGESSEVKARSLHCYLEFNRGLGLLVRFPVACRVPFRPRSGLEGIKNRAAWHGGDMTPADRSKEFKWISAPDRRTEIFRSIFPGNVWGGAVHRLGQALFAHFLTANASIEIISHVALLASHSLMSAPSNLKCRSDALICCIQSRSLR